MDVAASNSFVGSRKMSSYYGPVPEPDPGQPYNKYHWVKSAMQKLQSGCLKGTPSNEVCSLDLGQPLGMENGDILDADLSASTAIDGYPASMGRLNSYGAWCAYDGLPWIQVNFKVRVYITGLITQIISESYYVSTFSVKHGDSSSVLTYVTTSTGSVQIFTGKRDGAYQVTNRFSPVLHAQYLRIVPVSWKPEGNCCMRFEVLGCR
ncbi:lactadherin-like [Asterias rubens]|uniref:lactadherin-like n=1 Tax=Asterias rubens TaxID=7604 RepID=UPI0014558000|nr:lactadherin-like [Asterias rubens]